MQYFNSLLHVFLAVFLYFLSSYSSKKKKNEVRWADRAFERVFVVGVFQCALPQTFLVGFILIPENWGRQEMKKNLFRVWCIVCVVFFFPCGLVHSLSLVWDSFARSRRRLLCGGAKLSLFSLPWGRH